MKSGSKKKQGGSIPPWLLFIGVAGLIIAIAYAAMDSGTSLPQPAPKPAASQPQPAQPTAAQIPDPPLNAELAQWIRAGNIRMDAGLFDEAIRSYTHVLERDSLAVDVMVDRGACRHAKGDTEGALIDFKAAIRLAPLHEVAHFNLGITYYSAQMPDSARAWWRRLILLAPGTTAAQRAERLVARLDSTRAAP